MIISSFLFSIWEKLLFFFFSFNSHTFWRLLFFFFFYQLLLIIQTIVEYLFDVIHVKVIDEFNQHVQSHKRNSFDKADWKREREREREFTTWNQIQFRVIILTFELHFSIKVRRSRQWWRSRNTTISTQPVQTFNKNSIRTMESNCRIATSCNDFIRWNWIL